MFKSYFKIGWRNLSRNKGYTAINLFGLALGLTSGILILIYVLDEISYDRFHRNANRIYRLGTDVVDIKTGNINGTLETNGWPVGAVVEKDFPEIEKVVYVANASNLQVISDGKRFDERSFYVGKEFFEIFSFPFLKGNPATALIKPYSIVLTEAMEQKYFKGDGLGKTMILADTVAFEVTGVIKNVPPQSHMQFNLLISFATYETNPWFSYSGGWGNLNVRNYILFKEGVNKEAFSAKVRSLYIDHVKEDLQKWGMYMYVSAEPLNDIYLKTHRGNGMGPLGSIDRIYIVSGIAAFIILLACINYVNLSTARSVYRAKEIGLRKVFGSNRNSLINQFLSESFLLTLLSLAMAFLIIGSSLPLFNQLLGKNYGLSQFVDPVNGLGIITLAVLIAFVSGYYPAIVMSSLQAAAVLKGNMATSLKGKQLRRVLVVIQFVISSALVVCTLVVIDQLDFMQNRNLGFDGNQVLVLDADRVTDRGGRGSSEEASSSFKNELRSLASVESVTFTNAIPGKPGWVGQWAFPEDNQEDGSVSVEYVTVDEDYLKTLGLTLVAGHNFELGRPSENAYVIIVNETCVQRMGWGTSENAIGKKINSPSQYPAGTVIGVVKDYHEFGLQQQMYPMTMDYNPTRSRYFAIRFVSNGAADVLANLEALWKKHYPGYDFKYFFLDQNFALQYQGEKRLVKIFKVFSVVTVAIALIGLVGLVSFIVVVKTKEIGIRKILGANVFSIVQILSGEFILLVILSNAMACPLAWYGMNLWLHKFAYRTSIGIDLFAITFLIAVGLTLLTLSFQIIKAAMGNPINNLRAE